MRSTSAWTALGPPSTKFEAPPKDSVAFIVELPEIWSGVRETPAVFVENVRREADDPATTVILPLITLTLVDED